MKLCARLALFAAVLAPFAALGYSGPQVVMASPGIGDGAIERFTVRFNQAMVPLGDPRAAAPFAVKCPVEGQGRWVDPTTFVHEFSNPLPGGVPCRRAEERRVGKECVSRCRSRGSTYH